MPSNENQHSQRSPDEFFEIPYVAEMDPEFARDLDRFNTAVMEHMRSLFETFESARNKNNWEVKYARNDRKARAELELYYDQEHKTVIPNLGDGHCCMGVTLGLEAQGIRSAGSIMNDYMIDQVRRPYQVQGRGKREENPDLEDIVYHTMDSLLSASDFERNLRVINHLSPRFGTAILRYDMGRQTEYRVDPATGAIEETVGDLEPHVEVWPLEHVYVADLQESDPRKQEGLFWVTEGVTFYDLLPEEAVMEQVPGPDGLIAMRQSGRFRNLEALRRDLYNATQHVTSSNEDTDSERVSQFPMMRLKEYQGGLPLALWIEEGLLTPEVAVYYQILPRDIPDDIDNAEERRQWAMRAQRVTHWNVSYVEQGHNTTSYDLGHHLLQFEPVTTKRPRNSAYRFGFQPDGTRWYALGVVDLGGDLAKSADYLLNTKLRTDVYNANPSAVISERILHDSTPEDVMSLLRQPGQHAQTSGPGADPEHLVHWIQLPEVKNVMELVGLYIHQFEVATGITPAAKGRATANETGTATELQLQTGQAHMDIRQAIRANYLELKRLITDIWEDTLHYGEEDEVLDYMTRVTGMDATKIRQVIPHVGDIEEQLEITHPLTAGQDPAVISQLVLQAYQLWPDQIDPRKASLAMLEAGGYPQAELLMRDQVIRSPQDEIAQMEQGNWLDPQVGENYEQHIQAHQAALMQAEQRVNNALAAGEEPDPTDEMYLSLGPKHIEDTLTLLQVQQQQMLMEQQMMGQMGAGGGPSVQKHPQSAPAQGGTPSSAVEMGQQIAQQANQVPGV